MLGFYMVKRVLVVVGTRPEAIKMASVVKALRELPHLEVLLCATGQHGDLADQMLEFFELSPDYDLDLMREKQSLTHTTSSVLVGLEPILSGAAPSVVLVHGDTATTAAASLAAYFQGIPVAHVEAGLRTHNLFSPWPEEGNRRVVDAVSSLHFAPTERAKVNLIAEGTSPASVTVTGNTVVDALLFTMERMRSDAELAQRLDAQFAVLDQFAKVLLVTGHRRENFGDGLDQICRALARVAAADADTCIVYPLHPNPNVREPVSNRLGGIPNIRLIDPVGYPEFVYLMSRSFLILTDSGGVQEEAPTLGKPVLVMRDTTERPEAVDAGVAALVGADEVRIFEAVQALVNDPALYSRMAGTRNPFGDGLASARIAGAIDDFTGGSHRG